MRASVSASGSGRSKIAQRLARQEVTDLRASGMTWQAIGRLLGITASAAYQRYQTACREEPSESLDELRETAGRTLRRVIKGMMLRADAGDPKAADSITRAVQVHARVCGFEAPTRQLVAVADLTRLSDEELDAKRQELLGRILGQPVANALPALDANPENPRETPVEVLPAVTGTVPVVEPEPGGSDNSGTTPPHDRSDTTPLEPEADSLGLRFCSSDVRRRRTPR